MRFLQTAPSVVAILLCACTFFGERTASANEAFGLTKFTFCGVRATGGSASVTLLAAAFNEAGARVANATEGRIIRICETATGREIASLAAPTSLAQGKDDDVRFVAFSPDGARLVTLSSDGMARVWDIAGGRTVATLEHPSSLASATFSPDGTRLATSTRDRVARIWDIAGGRELAVLEPPSPVTSTVFSPDGKHLVTTCWEGTVHVWDAATGKQTMLLAGHDKKAIKARFSPDGARLATASEDNTVRLWDVAGGRTIHTLKHPSRVFSVAFSGDGSRIVTTAGKEARIYDAASGRETAVMKGHDTDVNDATFSPDGTRVATASDDRTVRIWQAANGAETAVLKGPSGGFTTVAFSRDGQRILALAGVEAVMWTKLSAASLPANIAGVWFGNFGPPNEPAEITRERCLRGPIRIRSDGLIVFFEASGSEPPQPALHLRCTSDLGCQVFAGAPGQGLEAQGTGNLEISGNAGKLCMAGECRPIARCPEFKWTAQERKSGLAKQWDKAVRAP